MDILFFISENHFKSNIATFNSLSTSIVSWKSLNEKTPPYFRPLELLNGNEIRSPNLAVLVLCRTCYAYSNIISKICLFFCHNLFFLFEKIKQRLSTKARAPVHSWWIFSSSSQKITLNIISRHSSSLSTSIVRRKSLHEEAPPYSRSLWVLNGDESDC